MPIREISKKSDYSTERGVLLREQYKNKPVLNELLKSLGLQLQELEDAIFQVSSLDENFGVLENASFDNLRKTGEMFGVVGAKVLNREDLALEIRASIVVVYSRCRIEDLLRLPFFLFNLKADVVETGEGAYLNIFGNLSEKKLKILFRSCQKLMPSGQQFFGIIQGGSGFFAADGFKESSGFRDISATADPTKPLSRMAIDENGDYLL